MKKYYKSSDVTKTHKTCNMCKQILPIENFSLCDRYGGRRGKCKPCQTEHKQRSKGTWKEYQKKKHIERNFILFRRKEREDVDFVMR